MSGTLAVFMEWVDSFRKIGVFTNADTPADAAVARKNGAQGIGLVRTGQGKLRTAWGMPHSLWSVLCMHCSLPRSICPSCVLFYFHMFHASCRSASLLGPLCRAHVFRHCGAHRRGASHDRGRGAAGGGGEQRQRCAGRAQGLPAGGL